MFQPKTNIKMKRFQNMIDFFKHSCAISSQTICFWKKCKWQAISTNLYLLAKQTTFEWKKVFAFPPCCQNLRQSKLHVIPLFRHSLEVEITNYGKYGTSKSLKETNSKMYFFFKVVYS